MQHTFSLPPCSLSNKEVVFFYLVLTKTLSGFDLKSLLTFFDVVYSDCINSEEEAGDGGRNVSVSLVIVRSHETAMGTTTHLPQWYSHEEGYALIYRGSTHC